MVLKATRETYPINFVWGNQANNVLKNDAEFQQGIPTNSKMRTDQLNSALLAEQARLKRLQDMGGYWDKDRIYTYGDLVIMYERNNKEPFLLQERWFLCNQQESKNNPPISINTSLNYPYDVGNYDAPVNSGWIECGFFVDMRSGDLASMDTASQNFVRQAMLMGGDNSKPTRNYRVRLGSKFNVKNSRLHPQSYFLWKCCLDIQEAKDLSRCFYGTTFCTQAGEEAKMALRYWNLRSVENLQEAFANSELAGFLHDSYTVSFIVRDNIKNADRMFWGAKKITNWRLLYYFYTTIKIDLNGFFAETNILMSRDREEIRNFVFKFCKKATRLFESAYIKYDAAHKESNGITYVTDFLFAGPESAEEAFYNVTAIVDISPDVGSSDFYPRFQPMFFTWQEEEKKIDTGTFKKATIKFIGRVPTTVRFNVYVYGLKRDLALEGATYIVEGYSKSLPQTILWQRTPEDSLMGALKNSNLGGTGRVLPKPMAGVCLVDYLGDNPHNIINPNCYANALRGATYNVGNGYGCVRCVFPAAINRVIGCCD